LRCPLPDRVSKMEAYHLANSSEAVLQRRWPIAFSFNSTMDHFALQLTSLGGREGPHHSLDSVWDLRRCSGEADRPGIEIKSIFWTDGSNLLGGWVLGEGDGPLMHSNKRLLSVSMIYII